jgi:hypothetical protein
MFGIGISMKVQASAPFDHPILPRKATRNRSRLR